MPATVVTGETIVQTVVDELSAHLPAKLATVAAPVLGATNPIRFGDPLVHEQTSLPMVSVALVAARPERQMGSQMLVTTELVVTAVVSYHDEETLHKYLLRYVYAIISVLETEVTVSSLSLKITGWEGSPTMDTAGGGLVQAAAVHCELPFLGRTRGDL